LGIKDKYNRRLQCGSITPIFYAIDDKYPLVNNRTRHTYKDITKILGEPDEMPQKLKYYIDNIARVKLLIKETGYDKIKNQDYFDLFCYWYDINYYLKKKKQGKIGRKNRVKLVETVVVSNVDVPSFLSSVDLTGAQYEPHSLKNPERIKIRDIIAKIEKSLVLPNFQRYFDWSREDVRCLLESIFNDYYIGSFLFWDVKDEPELETINIKGAESFMITRPESIILDGQQRMTSLYYAIKAPEYSLKGSSQPTYYYINFKAFFEKEKKQNLVVAQNVKYDREDTYKKFLFPLYELSDYGEWINGFEDYLLDSETVDRKRVIEVRRIVEKRIRHIWDGFEIPYISLPDTMNLRQVADIFENLNSKGKPLGVFDLLIARLLKYKLKLRDLWDDTRKKYPNIARYFKKSQKIPIYIFQAISLTYHKSSSCKREDILNIYENIYEGKDRSFEEDFKEFSEYLNKAITRLENLRYGYGVKGEKEMPFVPMLPILAALIRKVESVENKQDCYKKIDKWYWAAVFSNTYSSSVDSQLTSDYKDIIRWFEDDNKIPETVRTLRRKIDVNVDLRGVQQVSNAMYKGVLCLIALEGAKDFDTNQQLENADHNQKDHLFPKSKLYGFGHLRDINSVINMTWMSKATNTRIKKWKKPSSYIPEFIKEKYKGDEKAFLDMLETHLIDKNAYASMLKDADGYEEFFTFRNKNIMNKIKKKIGWTEADVVLEKDNTPITDLLKREEDETLEFKASFKKNIVTGEPDKNLKFASLKTIAGFLNNRGGRLIIGYGEKNREVSGMAQDYELCKHKDKDSFILEFWSYVDSNIPEDIAKHNIHLDFAEINGKEVCVIEVHPSTKAVYLKKNEKKILYVRKRNKTEPLEDPEKIAAYVNKHF